MNWERCKDFWPNAGMSRFVTLPPYSWHLQDAGSGPCILFLHGAAASTHTWRDILPPLAARFRVTAIDLPGQGFTRASTLSRCGLSAIADDIRALLADQRIEPDIIVGHSAGGAIALRLALDLDRAPGRIVAINPALGEFHGPAGTLFPLLARMLAVVPGPSSLFAWGARSPARVRRLIESTGSTLDERGLALYRLLLSDPAHVAATLAMMSRWDLSELSANLRDLTVPTLFLLGGRDRAVPPATAMRMAESMRTMHADSFAGLGHLLHEEAPELVVDALLRIGSHCGAERTESPETL